MSFIYFVFLRTHTYVIWVSELPKRSQTIEVRHQSAQRTEVVKDKPNKKLHVCPFLVEAQTPQ